MKLTNIGCIGSLFLSARETEYSCTELPSLLLSIVLCWREIRPDAGKTTENEFVASFL